MRGSLPLKIRLSGCDPIRRASGVHDPKMRRKLVEMIKALHEQGRDDLVNGIASGTLKPLQVFNRWKFNRLSELPYADELPLFSETWPRWLASLQCSDEHRQNTRYYFKRFDGMLPKDATIGQVVGALREYRAKMLSHPRAFNLAKSNVQAFLKATLGRRHRTYMDAVDIPAMPIVTRRAQHPLTADQLRDLVQQLGEPYGPMAWTMSTTGMGWKEYAGPWEREGEGLRIHGTKRKGRDRLIPIVSWLYRPVGTINALRWKLQHVTDGRITPYDFRRTYAGLMVEAGIPAPRRALYMGHSPKSMTELYEMHEVRDLLVRDAERLRIALSEPPEGPKFHLIRAERTA